MGTKFLDQNGLSFLVKELDKRYASSAKANDADKLDGEHGSFYLDYNNFTNKPISYTSIDDAFISRQTANGSNIADGKAELRKIYGNSKRLNQQSFDYRNTVIGYNTLYGMYGNISRNSDGSLRWVANNEAHINAAWRIQETHAKKFITDGHVYFTTYTCRVVENKKNIQLYATVDSNMARDRFINGSPESTPLTNSWTTYSDISIVRPRIDSTPNEHIIYWRINPYTPSLESVEAGDITVDMKDFMLVDLTQLYNGNSNIPSSIVEFNSDGSIKSYSVDKFLEENPEYNNYVEFNEGSIEGVKPKELKSTGKNLVNIPDILHFSGYSTMRYVNLPAGTYSIDFEFEGGTTVGAYSYILPHYKGDTFDYGAAASIGYGGTKKTVTFKKFVDYINLYAGTGNTDASYRNIIIAKGSQVFPYEEYHENTLPLVISKYFPNGMYKAGDVRDEFDLKRGVAISKVLKIPFIQSNLNMARYSSLDNDDSHCFYISLSNIKANTYVHGRDFLEFNKVFKDVGAVDTKTMKAFDIGGNAGSTDTYWFFMPTTFNTVNEVKEWAEDIYFLLEDKNPSETPIAPEDLQILYDAFDKGTETFVYEDTDYPVEVPCEIKYRESVNEDFETFKKEIDLSIKEASASDDTKLDKVTTVTSSTQLYAKYADGTQGMNFLSSQPDEGSVAARGAGGVLRGGTPVGNTDLTTKKYVDDKFSTTYISIKNEEIDNLFK